MRGTDRAAGSAAADREWDRRLRIDTAGRDTLEAGGDRSPYEPTPYAVLERLAAAGGLSSGDHLLDLGCGKGRAVLYLAWRLGCRASGVDCSARMIAAAAANCRRCPAGRRVSLTCCAAEAFPLNDETALFFFNPFSEKVLRVVLDRLRTSLRERPRPVRLFFYYPSDEYRACLMTRPGLVRQDEIDCRDLFAGNDRRERIMVFTAGGSTAVSSSGDDG